ncbi:MAG: 16S rRNA (guanine(527)-N(7))-methyltransferase RsmG, partial [Bryobacteraceae bacterium]|nr:16S rRNA (guanine(527)-N(7))-methyltransferase RsmG [Bryobacteraceae bacterium]
LDSVVPWELFRLVSNDRHVLDAGTGAGFPGIPLALVLPDVQFTLSESIQKKARFVEEAVRELSIPNITVTTQRAETFLLSTKTGIITARAVAPVAKAVDLFGPALRQGARALLYKGPDVQSELETAAANLRKRRLTASVIKRYELPDDLGSRSILELCAF